MYYVNPKYQQFNISGVKHIDAVAASFLLKEGKAVLIDVREEEEYEEGIPDVANIQFFPLSKTLSWILPPNNQQYIVMCAHGIRSVRVCAWLESLNFGTVMSLDGGFEQWHLCGQPVRKI